MTAQRACHHLASRSLGGLGLHGSLLAGGFGGGHSFEKGAARRAKISVTHIGATSTADLSHKRFILPQPGVTSVDFPGWSNPSPQHAREGNQWLPTRHPELCPFETFLASLKPVVRDHSSQEVVERIFAHRPIRDGLERILQGREGALIVLGNNMALGEVSVDGLELTSAVLDAARLSELAKMDGAITLDNEWRMILTANTHLAPPPNIPTTESGARHRTAERIAQVTGLPVVTVSKDRAVVTLYINGDQVDLTPRWTIRRRILQHLQILVELRKRFDEADERLLRMELLGLATAQEVAHLLRMGEMVGRAAADIEAMMADSVQDPATTEALLADRVFEVERIVDITLRDYLGAEADSARKQLSKMLPHQLGHTWLVVSEVGLEGLEGGSTPRGSRLLYKAGISSRHLTSLLFKAYPDAQSMLHAPVEGLMQIRGIGHKNATRLRWAFDRLLAAVNPIGQRILAED